MRGLRTVALGVVALTALGVPAAGAGSEGCTPTARNRPVCPASAPLATATFVDPSAEVRGPRHVRLGARVYVGPFATLDARRGAITVGSETNVQDPVAVLGGVRRSGAEATAAARAGLAPGDGVAIGDRVIMAHGVTVLGPAQVGVEGADSPLDPGREQNVALGLGSRVDGAVLERNTSLSQFARVGPGVRLRSGTVVLQGKNVTTQAEADDPALGKVRALVDGDVAFNITALDANVRHAREYSRLAREDRAQVRGISTDPGTTGTDPDRELPAVDATLLPPDPLPDTCVGDRVERPRHRNRLIGAACFADSLRALDRALGDRISVRVDEGETVQIGTVARMGDGTVLHTIEGTGLFVGDRVTYGEGVLLHGGGRGAPGLPDPRPQTIVEDDVTIGAGALVFRATVGAGATVGARAIVLGSDVPPGATVPDRQLLIGNQVVGEVEW
jgi:carbonic anhydrase/acetyltransferase-like protein (isoleucine patch superfamily)